MSHAARFFELLEPKCHRRTGSSSQARSAHFIVGTGSCNAETFVQGSAARAARSFFRRVKRRGVRFPLTHVSAFADPACLGMRSIRDGLGPVTVAFDGLNRYYGVVCLAPVSLCGLAPTSGTAQRLMVIRAVPLEGGTRGSVARRYPTNDRRFSVG